MGYRLLKLLAVYIMLTYCHLGHAQMPSVRTPLWQTHLGSADTVRARASWHGGNRNVHVLTFYVGYIDSNMATVQEMIDNVVLGIIPSNSAYLVDSTEMFYGRSGTDFVGPIAEAGNKFTERQLFSTFNPFIFSKRIEMSIWAKLRRHGSDRGLWYSRKIILR